MSTEAQIRYRNLVGQRYIALTRGRRVAARRLQPRAARSRCAQTQPALDLTVLFNGFKPLFAALNPEDVNQLRLRDHPDAAGRGRHRRTRLLAHTASLTTTLADRDEVIGRAIDNLNAVLGTRRRARRPQLSTLIAELQRFVSGLAEDREAIGASLTNIADLAEATAGLLKDVRPADPQRRRASSARSTGTLNDNEEIVDGRAAAAAEQAEHASPGPRRTARGSTSTSATSPAA